MRRNWRQLVAEAVRRNDHHDALAGIVAGVGAAIAIGVMEWSSLESHTPLGIIPFATSIVLAVGSPQVEPAQPRALIGGHVVATLVGLGGCRRVGLAVLAMYVTGTFHPPAGINPLLVVSNNLSWSFLFAPVLAGVLLLTAFAFVWHRWVRRRPWPHRWL
jgi:CBS-domain-containing membrane protein